MTEIPVSSNEIRMDECTLAWTFFDTLKVPHIQLTAEGSILGLRKEKRQEFDQSIGVMDEKPSAL